VAKGMNLTQNLTHAPALKMMMMMMTGFGLALWLSTSVPMYLWIVIMKQVAFTALMSCVGGDSNGEDGNLHKHDLQPLQSFTKTHTA
jgi:hypothetical protein